MPQMKTNQEANTNKVYQLVLLTFQTLIYKIIHNEVEMQNRIGKRRDRVGKRGKVVEKKGHHIIFLVMLSYSL